MVTYIKIHNFFIIIRIFPFLVSKTTHTKFLYQRVEFKDPTLEENFSEKLRTNETSPLTELVKSFSSEPWKLGRFCSCDFPSVELQLGQDCLSLIACSYSCTTTIDCIAFNYFEANSTCQLLKIYTCLYADDACQHFLKQGLNVFIILKYIKKKSRLLNICNVII